MLDGGIVNKMSKIRGRSEQIRNFILENVSEYPDSIGKVTAAEFSITKQAVNKHLDRLIAEGCLIGEGATRGRTYKLASIVQTTKTYLIEDIKGEDVIWREEVKPGLGQLPDNVFRIWEYGITEIVNNAIDHSEGTSLTIMIVKTAVNVTMYIVDDGVGIFKKIQRELNLLDESHAVLELSKGKLTTDPVNHTGEGLFFSTRMFDSFGIRSGNVYYNHDFGREEDWIHQRTDDGIGTTVFLQLSNHTVRTVRQVFDQYTSQDGEYSFSKTVVPVKLAQYAGDSLVSRSQAKRLLSRVELFKTVMFDFSDVEEIGQAFADEIFRVFANAHPEIILLPYDMTEAVKDMVDRARDAAASQQTLFEK